MPALRSFDLLGEKAEVQVDGSTSANSMAVLVITSPPGSGPPPHIHSKEVEALVALTSGYEVFDGKSWTPLTVGEVSFTPRGAVHTYRNAGKSEGKIVATMVPAGLETFLERLGALRLPEEVDKLAVLSMEFGVRFV